MKIYELCLSIVENFNATKGKKKKKYSSLVRL